jgi:hypothetical protein
LELSRLEPAPAIAAEGALYRPQPAPPQRLSGTAAQAANGCIGLTILDGFSTALPWGSHFVD